MFLPVIVVPLRQRASLNKSGMICICRWDHTSFVDASPNVAPLPKLMAKWQQLEQDAHPAEGKS